MVVGSRGGSFWDLQREFSVPEERAWATQREAQRKQPECRWGLMKCYGQCLAIMQGESIARAGACLAQRHKH